MTHQEGLPHAQVGRERGMGEDRRRETKKMKGAAGCVSVSSRARRFTEQRGTGEKVPEHATERKRFLTAEHNVTFTQDMETYARPRNSHMQFDLTMLFLF